MSAFRVTKYNPKLRLPDGSYSVEDWTGLSDIGRVINGRVFECAEYLHTESAYVMAVQTFLLASGTTSLQVSDLQINDVDNGSVALLSETKAHLNHLSEGAEVGGSELDWVVRLALREAIWCRLEGSNGFYTHFGYDYYMYIGSEGICEAPGHLPTGIYAEAMESPYRREDAD